MSTYQALRSYSPVHDCDVVRVSMGNEHGHELWMLIVDNEGARRFRAKRTAALDAIMEAIDLGCDPGEVRVEPAAWKQMVNEAMMERAE